jgi:hypothetical protein
MLLVTIYYETISRAARSYAAISFATRAMSHLVALVLPPGIAVLKSSSRELQAVIGYITYFAKYSFTAVVALPRASEL